ncbi:TIR domain-containing protein [Vibrio algarum]|uniref:TIR domain-containing protein n=1 Tax=Vibrio algarum TaxID=3020714 RepID=A0ABT4YTL0_9VIBR|nr:TIR domain-containing protein [Vibrio sp. KJ40-1]MDB1124695.1 TIR domain-containing protein [Vibrio sp. KJ40-1]
MGGGGGYGFSQVNKEILERRAKELIKKATEEPTRNVFISFSHQDMDEVNLLRGQAKNDNNNLEFSDYSVKKAFDSEDAPYIRRKITEKIEQASVTMIYLSEKSMDSRWVKWEVEKSRELGKGVIAVHKGDAPPTNIPKHISDNVSSVVKWNHDAISKAVQEAAENR